MTTTQQQVKLVKFPRLERGGFMWGLDGLQFAILIFAVGSVVALLPIGFGAAMRQLVIAVPLGVCGVLSWGGRSFISRATVFVAHMRRKMQGKTVWKMTEKPFEAGALPLPGKPGARVTVHGTKWGKGAVLFDAGEQRASVVLRCESVGWPLSDDRDLRADAFANVCKSLVRRPHIERVAIQARTVPATRAAAVRWHNETAVERSVEDAWGQAQMERVLEGNGFVDGDGNLRGPESRVVPVQRDTLVVISMSVRRAARSIKAAGGGIGGAAQVLAGEVRQFHESLKGCGVSSSEWLTPAQVADAVRVALDPEASDRVQQMAAARTDENDITHAATMLVDDTDPRFVVTSGAHHATYWIGQWPQTEVAAGFLEQLICEGDYPHAVTMVLTPESERKALSRIESQQQALDSKMDLNQRLKRPTSVIDKKAQAELEERAEEIASGHVNVRVCGYVRVSGVDADDLQLNSQTMERDATRLDLQLLKRQQWEAFCASSLPLGWGL